MVNFCVVTSLCICMIVNGCILAETRTVSDTITEIKTFYYQQLSKYPSTRISIEISLLNVGWNQRLTFYLFDHQGTVIDRNCSFHDPVPVQLRNENFYIPLRKDGYKYITCVSEKNIFSCHGKMTIQDFEPRHVGFSLGITCRNVHNPLFNLKGLTYNVIIREMSNTTQCLPLTSHSEKNCSKFYSYATIPNLIGHQKKSKATYDRASMYRILKVMNLHNIEKPCYQHLHELLCYVFTPKYDSDTKRMVPMCRESCLDFLNGCVTHALSLSPKLRSIISDLVENFTPSDIYKSMNCNYLPPANGSAPCFHKPVSCPAPPTINNGFKVNASNITAPYPADSIQQYVCQDQYNMTKNSTVTCLYSGLRSEAPTCNHNFSRNSSVDPLPIVIPILILALLLFVFITVKLTCSKKPILHNPERNKEYDAFVCYDITDAEYAHDTIIDELEVKCNPPFKLCIHKRDFRPSYTIKWNIWNTIKNSNSAIIVMSQSYVDSIWCRNEFEGCYVEDLEDPAYRLFVIMMQPVDTLKNTDEYMKSFFASKTYLEKDAEKLFEKIAEYLKMVKQPKLLNKNENVNIEINDNELVPGNSSKLL